MTPKHPVDPHWSRFLELLAPIHDRAAATARRLSRSAEDGDDLFQEAVLRACTRFSSLRDRERFRSWFFSILLSVHRNRSRRSFWRRFLSLETRLAGGWTPVGADGGEMETERRRAASVARALAVLPAVQREAVVLFEMEGYSIEEIARMQGSSIPAVKTRLSRGRERLRRWYEEVSPRDSETLAEIPGSCDGIVAARERA
jgi:RNA polymerase sigma-70 factor (ECF subfamily)